MQNIVSFTYTKENGDVSERDLIPLISPGEKYFGIDITELDMEDQTFFAKEVYDIQQEQQAKIKAVMEKYDIGNAYRTFLVARMSDISVDQI